MGSDELSSGTGGGAEAGALAPLRQNNHPLSSD